MGIDKFSNTLANWERYLAPWIHQLDHRHVRGLRGPQTIDLPDAASRRENLVQGTAALLPALSSEVYAASAESPQSADAPRPENRCSAQRDTAAKFWAGRPSRSLSATSFPAKTVPAATSANATSRSPTLPVRFVARRDHARTPRRCRSRPKDSEAAEPWFKHPVAAVRPRPDCGAQHRLPRAHNHQPRNRRDRASTEGRISLEGRHTREASASTVPSAALGDTGV